MAYNPYENYKQQSVKTMTQGEMVTSLMDEMLIQLNKSIYAIEEKQIDKANQALQKTQKIINYLISSLNTSMEISKSLETVYVYLRDQLFSCNLRKDVEGIRLLIPIVEQLKEGFIIGSKQKVKQKIERHRVVTFLFGKYALYSHFNKGCK